MRHHTVRFVTGDGFGVGAAGVGGKDGFAEVGGKGGVRQFTCVAAETVNVLLPGLDFLSLLLVELV